MRNARSNSLRGPVVVAIAGIVVTSCGGNSCPAGRTAAENGTCVDQRVVDFVACIDRANGSERSASGRTTLSAEVRAASVGVGSAADFQRTVTTRIYAGSDAQGQQILAACNNYVFGGLALQNGGSGGGGGGSGSGGAHGGAPPGSGPASPHPGPPAPSGPPGSSPAGSGCAVALAVPNDSSWSLREREQWAALVRGTQGALDAVNDSCRARIGGSIDFESFRGHFTAANTHGLDNDGLQHVRAPFNAVQQICDDGDMQKSAVRSKIQCITVRYVGGSGRSSWSLQGSVLTGAINPTGESDFDYRAEMRGPNGVRRSL